MDGERGLQASSTPAIAVSMNVAVGSVVQDEGLIIKDEPADTDLDAGPAAPQHVDAHCRRSEAKANFTEEEPGLAELVKSEPALLVKEEVVEDSWQDIAELQCMQGPSTSAIVGSTNVFDSVADPSNTLNIKEELGAIDIGPTVLQPMDTQGTTKQKDMSFVKQERTINHHNLSPILCGGVKEEIIEDEWRGSPTLQDSLMEHPGACTALHSLRKECLETVCRVQLIRLDTFQCDVCYALYIDAHKLFQHVQDLHGPGPKRSLHVKSPEISIGPHQCATVSSPVVYTCDYCHKTYSTKQGLVNHMEVVHTKVRYRCTECNKEFTGKLALQAHVRRIHSKEKHEADTGDQHSNKAAQSEQRARSQSCSCDKCGKTYACKKSLKAHYRNLHSTESHICTKCDRKFPSKNYLYQHTRNAHSEQQYECAVCKKIYKSKLSLTHHGNQFHWPRPAGSKARIYTCDYCKKMFIFKKDIQSHIALVHSSGSYKCHQCDKIFRCKVYLMRHKTKVHTAGSKPRIYTCDYCKKMFTNKGTIGGHIAQLHSSGSYTCFQCNKIFKCKKYLMQHNTYMHPAGSHQLHTCTNCGRNFKSKWHCQRHEKRVKCTRPTAGNTSAAASTSRQQHNVVMVKEEPADGELELGPVVFQHMDCNYRPYKQEPQLD